MSGVAPDTYRTPRAVADASGRVGSMIGRTKPAWLDAHPLDFQPTTLRGCVGYVTDGDTVHVELDEGRRRYSYVTLRVLGINAPDKDRPDAMAAATTFAAHLVAGYPCGVQLRKADKYGERYDATLTVYIRDSKATSGWRAHDFAAEMLASGHAVPYDGGAR